MISIRELKERRLVQIVVSYAIIGWGVLGVTDQLADRGIVPELLYRIVLIWYLFGFPAMLLIGWHHGEKGRQKAPLSEIALVLMLAVMAAGMSVSSAARERALRELAQADENPLEMRRIAVAYFNDFTPAHEYQYLADGLTEDLIVALSQVQGLSVVSRNGSLQFRGAEVAADSLARALKAGTVVEGDLEERNGQLRISVRVLDGRSGQVYRRHTFAMAPDKALAARDSVAETAARLLREWIGPEIRVRESAASTASTAAWALQQRAEKSRKDADRAFREGQREEAAALFAAADGMFDQAARLDPQWADPVIGRASVAYRQAYLLRRPDLSAPFIEAGLEHAEEALRRSRTAARAWEIRGTLSYYRWLLQLDQDDTAREQLLQRATSDLETAVRFDPLLASAHATLAHALDANGDNRAAVLASQKAYETDMYLENAELVLFRLFNGVLEQGSFARARGWCDEGRRRFPADFRIAQCELRLLVTPATEAEQLERSHIDTAWAVVARVDSLAPPARREAQRLRNELLAAGVIARVARRQNDLVLLDSARAVLQRAQAAVTPSMDPTRETLLVAAYSWLLVGDQDRAVAQLQDHAASDPQFWASTRGEVSWWWRDLAGNPRFRALVGLAQ